MEADYKTYARDLYNIKLAVIGNRPAAKNLSALKTFLHNVNDLRPKLRQELNQLAQEFIAMVPNASQDLLHQFKEVNHVYLRKLQAYANHIKRDIRTYSA